MPKIKLRGIRDFLGVVFSGGPWILEPSQRRRVGQKTNMIWGVPDPERSRKGGDKTVIMEAMMATLFLNQRFKRRMSKMARRQPRIILGSLMA